LSSRHKVGVKRANFNSFAKIRHDGTFELPNLGLHLFTTSCWRFGDLGVLSTETHQQTMKPKPLLCLALVLSGGLLGCSTSHRLHDVNWCPPIGGHGAVDGGDGMDDVNSHIFGIEAKVISIRKTPAMLESITMKLIRPLPTALGWVPYEKPGEIVVIHFDESFSKMGSLQLATGSIIQLNFGEIDNSSNWGSNSSWLYVEKNGAFYNAKGEKAE
jgi:hypothetical protein